MMFKCIEPTSDCPLKCKYGDNYYCGLDHKPSHKLLQSHKGGRIDIDEHHCAEKPESPLKKEIA